MIPISELKILMSEYMQNLEIKEVSMQLEEDQDMMVNQFERLDLSERGSLQLPTLPIEMQSEMKPKIQPEMQSQTTTTTLKPPTQTILDGITKYFSQLGAKLDQGKLIYLQDCPNSVKQQLLNGELEVSKNPIMPPLKKRLQLDNQQQNRKEFERKKAEAIKKLRQLQSDEFQLNRKRSHFSLKQKLEDIIPPKKQTDLEVRRVLQAQQKAEERRKIKKAEWLHIQEKEREREQQLIKSRIEKEKGYRRVQIEAKLRQIEANALQRTEQLKQSRAPIQRAYLYQQFGEKDYLVEKKLEEEKQQKLQEVLSRNKLDTKQLLQHQLKYDEYLERSKSESPSRIRKGIAVRQELHLEANKYDLIVEEQLEKERQFIKERVEKQREKKVREAILKYQAHIDLNFKPPQSETTFKPIEKNHSSVTLSKKEAFNKGLQYLDIAKKLKRAKSIEKMSTPTEAAESFRPYKDYLPEIKRKYTFDTEKQFQQLTTRSPIIRLETVERAKKLVDSLEAKMKKLGDDRAYFSVQNKLKLLSGLY